MSTALIANRATRPTLTARVGRGMLWNVAGKSVVTGLSFVMGVVLARGLSPAEFGAYSLVWAMYMTLLLVSSLGVETGLMKYVPELHARNENAAAREVVGAAMGGKLALLLAVSAVFVAVSDVIVGRLFGGAQLRAAYLYLIPGLLVPCGLNATYRSVLESEYQQRLVNLVDVVQIVGRLAGVIAALSWQFGVLGVMLANLLVEWIVLVIYAIAARGALAWPRAGWTPQLRKLATFSVTIWVMTLASILIGKNSDLLLLGAFADTPTTGMYNLAYTFALQAYMVMTLPLGNLALVAAAELTGSGDEGRLWRATGLFLKYHLLFVPPLCLGEVLLAEPLVTRLYGAEYLPTVVLLKWYLVVFAINILFSGPFTTLLISMEQHRAVMIANIGAGVLNLAANLVLVPRFGALGAIAGTGLANVVSVIWLGVLLRRQIAWEFPFAFALKTVLAAAAMGVSAVWLAPRATGWPALTLIVAGCALIYATALKLTRPFSEADLALLGGARIPGSGIVRRLLATA